MVPFFHEACTLHHWDFHDPIAEGCTPCGSWPEPAMPEERLLPTQKENAGREEKRTPRTVAAREEYRWWTQTRPNGPLEGLSGQ